MMYVAFNIGEPTDLIDRVIKFFTGGKCYHCELVFSNDESFGSKPQDGGTRFMMIDYSNKDKWKLIALPWITESDEVVIREFCKREDGCKYDWWAVFIGWLITPSASNRNWFCTEIVHAAIKPFTKYMHDRWYSPIQLVDELYTESFWQTKLGMLNK